MEKDINILYIHGMGGGGDSRIPSILREYMELHSIEGAEERINVVVRTYDFNPEIARGQIDAWVDELQPELVIGESLGSINALRVHGMPHIFVSPSLNAPLFLSKLAPLTRIPGVTKFLDWIYKPRPGDRQPLHFDHKTLSHYKTQRKEALSSLTDSYFAFFGTRDHYRRSGIVSIRTWRKYFGENTYSTYKGTHFMEEEYVISMLVPKISEVLFGGRHL